MAYLKNISNKIIGGLGESFLPGTFIPYTDELKEHPTIKSYLSQKILKVTDGTDLGDAPEAPAVSDEERKRIAEAAVEAYRKELEEREETERLRQETIDQIRKMKKKADLEAKAVELGVELNGSDTNKELQERLIAKVSG